MNNTIEDFQKFLSSNLSLNYSIDELQILKVLDLSSKRINQEFKFDLSFMPKLLKLNLSNCDLKGIFKLNAPNITSLNIRNNQLTKVILNAPKLWNVNCTNNQINKIEILENEISCLVLDYNTISDFDLILPELKIFGLSNNPVKNINLSNCKKLTQVVLKEVSELTSLKLSESNLKILKINNSKLENLKIKNTAKLDFLDLENNELMRLDFDILPDHDFSMLKLDINSKMLEFKKQTNFYNYLKKDTGYYPYLSLIQASELTGKLF